MAMYYTPIPHGFLEEMGELSDAEYGRLIRWCQRYSITGEETELRGNERFYRVLCKNQIDKINSHYEKIAERNRANGAKGGRPRKNPEKPRETQKNPAVFLETQRNPEKPKKPNINNINIKNNNININNNDLKEKDNISDEILWKKKADKVINAWNVAALESGTIPRIERVSRDSKRGAMLSALLDEHGLEKVLQAIDNIRDSRFLQGKTTGWRIRFDWFICSDNFVKVLEGNYADTAEVISVKDRTAEKRNRPHNFEEGDHDRDELLEQKADKVMNAWNDIALESGTIPRVERISRGSKRGAMLSARLDEHGLEKVLQAIDNIRDSRFLQGKTTGWRIRFDWFVCPDNFVKVLEGNYADRETTVIPVRGCAGGKRNKFHNFTERDYDCDELLRQINGG